MDSADAVLGADLPALRGDGAGHQRLPEPARGVDDDHAPVPGSAVNTTPAAAAGALRSLPGIGRFTYSVG